MKRLAIAASFVVMVGAVAYSASLFRPGSWYAELVKPAWTPPDWLFAPVWTVLYMGIAIAGWLIFTRTANPSGRWLWCAQLALNGLWSWLFFGLHLPAAALVDLTALLVCLVALLRVLAPRQRAAFYLLAPYCAWAAYAWSLNAAVVVLNP